MILRGAACSRLDNLPESDLAHLAGDIRRVLTRTLPLWLAYVAYL